MRRQAREVALQILFQLEFSPDIVVADLLQLIGQQIPREAMAYAESLVAGVKANKTEIDARLQSVSSHWKVERMTLVDRNVLRLAVFEMKFASEKLDAAIIMNEAIEIARKFASPESGSFVNGLLDQIAREEGLT